MVALSYTAQSICASAWICRVRSTRELLFGHETMLYSLRVLMPSPFSIVLVALPRTCCTTGFRFLNASVTCFIYLDH